MKQLVSVRTDGLLPGRYPFPDFLLVGPQRTGTSWLHAMLRQHPQFYLPVKKELYFFSHLLETDSPRFNSAQLAWYVSRFAPGWRFRLRRYLSGMKRLRRPFVPRLVMGEATASYATMPEFLIRELVLLQPQIKIIVLVRHPIDRAWSHAKKDIPRATGRALAQVTFAEFQAFYTHPYQVRCGRFSEWISVWQQHLKPGHLLIEPFSDIATDPASLLRRICAFLGVSKDITMFDARALHLKVNPTSELAPPSDHRDLLGTLFADEIEHLNQLGLLNRLAD